MFPNPTYLKLRQTIFNKLSRYGKITATTQFIRYVKSLELMKTNLREDSSHPINLDVISNTNYLNQDEILDLDQMYQLPAQHRTYNRLHLDQVHTDAEFVVPHGDVVYHP